MTDFFEWNPSTLALDVPEMDREHQVIISQMNKLHEMHEDGMPLAAISRALDEFVRYTAKHFADEEAYMDEIAFPGKRIHAGVHRQLLERLAGFQLAVRETGKLPAEIFVFFKMWLTAHIRGIDTKYASHAHA